MLLLDNPIQNYAWGSHTALAELMGRAVTSRPEAELWIGAHPKAPSRTSDGRTLLEHIEADRAGTLGAAVSRDFEGRLPFLLKVLAVAQPLSLQAHPDRAQAREGFAREQRAGIPLDAAERNYKDDNHKPELLCALEPFEALSGFRAPAEAAALLAELGLERSELARELASPAPEPLRAAFDRLQRLDADARARLVAQITTRAPEAIARGSRFTASYRWAVTLAGPYPGDIGTACSLLLNYIALEPFEAIFLEAGRLHAYLKGVGVEIMANSDNVLRGGLTPKHVDVPELCRVLRFDARAVAPVPTAVRGSERRYETPAREFVLSCIELDAQPFDARVTGPELLLCTEGGVELGAPDAPAELVLGRGAACFVPAARGSYRARGQGRLFRATVP